MSEPFVSIRDWLRFRGWRNAYWREDAIAAKCPHDGQLYRDDTLAGSVLHVQWFCVDCGSLVASPLGSTWSVLPQSGATSATNVVTYLRVRVPR